MIADVKIDMKTARNRKNKTKQKLKKMTQYDIICHIEHTDFAHL